MTTNEITISNIRSEMRSEECVSLQISIDDRMMFASPMSNGKWQVTKKDKENEITSIVSHKQAEEIASELINSAKNCNFESDNVCDGDGYCVGVKYSAIPIKKMGLLAVIGSLLVSMAH